MSINQKLQQELFDLTSDGVLICKDPIIGPLHNPKRHLSVKLNGPKARLELVHEGAVEQTFDLARGMGRACQDAFSAYFRTFEKLCRQRSEKTAAA